MKTIKGPSTSSLEIYDRPVDRIRLHLQATTSVPLLVEGPSDELTLKPHLTNVTFFPVRGRTNVVACLRELGKTEIEKVMAIIDLDFDKIDEFEDLASVIHHYDGADLEAMLVTLGVLSELLMHIGSTSKINLMGGADEVVKTLKECISPISSLRLASRNEQLGLSFDDVDLQGKIDRKALTLNLDSYCSALAAVSTSETKTPDLVRIAESRDVDRHSGKDLAAAAGVALRYRAGSLPSAATTRDQIASQLRASSGLALSRSRWLADLVTRLNVTRSLVTASLVGSVSAQ